MNGGTYSRPQISDFFILWLKPSYCAWLNWVADKDVRTGWLLGLDKASFRLVIVFNRCTTRLSHWQRSGRDSNRTIAGYIAMRRSYRILNFSFIIVQAIVVWGWRRVAGTSIRVWILCGEPTSRLSLSCSLNQPKLEVEETAISEQPYFYEANIRVTNT